MLELANITFKAFGKVRSKDLAFINQSDFFGDFDDVKRLCLGGTFCDDFIILNIKFRKAEVLK